MSATHFVRSDIRGRLDSRGHDLLTLSPDLVSRLSASFISDPAPQRAGFQTTMYAADRDYRRAVFERLRPIVAEVAADVLDGYRVCVASWLIKDPGAADSTVGLHQDWSFIDERRGRSVNLWIPLTDVDLQNGCLEVVDHSHTASTDLRAHGDFRFRTLASELRAQYVRPVPMTRGQALIYDGALLHSSPPNRSAERRVAAGAVLVPEDATVIHCFRVSPAEVEVFAVDDAFFWSHVPGTRPANVPLLGVVRSSAGEHAVDVLTHFAARM